VCSRVCLFINSPLFNVPAVTLTRIHLLFGERPLISLVHPGFKRYLTRHEFHVCFWKAVSIYLCCVADLHVQQSCGLPWTLSEKIINWPD
jgi:hypothetical protein